MLTARRVEPEWLDLLPADDPRALHSRQDIHRLNRLMNSASILARLLTQYGPSKDIARLADLGASDGRMTLRLARHMAPRWGPLQAILVDIKTAASAATRQELHALGWSPHPVIADVFDWLRQTPPVDVIVANLFLHHFQPGPLAQLLSQVSQKTNFFVACEPRRSSVAWQGCRLLGLLGCNDVTRHDAAASVQAGFRAHELSEAWPDPHGWLLQEHAMLPFSHCFIAQRRQGG